MTGWAETALGDIGAEVRNSVVPDPSTHYVHYSVPSFADGEPVVEFGEEIKSNKRSLQAGDLLVCRINPRINRVWLVAEHDAPIIGSTEWIVFRLPESSPVERRFLLWYLRSPRFRARITGAVSGVTGSHTRAKAKDVLKYPVPVPSQDEQHAIVDAVERMLSKLAAARADLSAVGKGRELARAAALEDVVRRAAMQGTQSGLADLWDSARYGTSEKCAEDGPGAAVLRIPNVRRRRVDLEDIKYAVDADADVSSSYVAPGDLLVIRTNGSSSLIGRVAAAPAFEGSFACASYLIRLRLRCDMVQPEYLAAVLEAPSLRSQIVRLAASSAGQYNLSVAKLKQLAVPVPALQVQDELVADLQLRESLLDHGAEMAAAALHRCDALQRSILKAAFEGGLTRDAQSAHSLDDIREAVA